MEKSSSNYRWVMVGVLWLVHAIGFLNFSSLGIFAPFIQEDFGLSSLQIGFFISALSIGAALTQMPVGLITDFVGVRFLLTLGIGLIGFFLALFSFAPSYPSAILIIFIYGLSSGFITPTASKSILDWFPAVGRATAMGIKQTGVNFGGILGGLLLPVLVLSFSWRHSLLMLGIAETAFAALVYKLAREFPAKSGKQESSFDWGKIGSVIQNRDILLLGGICFVFMASQFCFSGYLTLFLTKELNYSVVQSGHYFALAYLLGGVARLLWSLFSDYLLGGRRKGVLLLIASIMFFSLLALSLISFFPAVSTILGAAVLAFGISGIGWNAIYLTLLGEALGKESIGLATGAGYFFGFLGSLLCPPFFGYLVDKTGIYGYAWLFLALCAAANLFLLSRYHEKGVQEG